MTVSEARKQLENLEKEGFGDLKLMVEIVNEIQRIDIESISVQKKWFNEGKVVTINTHFNMNYN